MQQIFTQRQLVQSALQFGIIFVAGVGKELANGPLTWNAVGQSALTALSAAFVILWASFAPPTDAKK